MPLPKVKLRKKIVKKKEPVHDHSYSPNRHKHCQYCKEIYLNDVKANPMKYSQETDKLKAFTKLYQEYVLAGKTM